MTSVLDPETMAALQRRFAESPAGGPVVMRPEDHGAIPSSAQLASMDPLERMDSRKRFQVAAGLDETPVEGGTRVPPTGITDDQRARLAERFAPVSIASGAGPLRVIARGQEAKADDARERASAVARARQEALDLSYDSQLQFNMEARAKAQAELESALEQQRSSKAAIDAARENADRYRAEVANELEYASMANMTRREFDEAKATLADPLASEEEKLAAERALDRGKEIDPTAWLGTETWQKAVVGIAMALSAAFEGYAAGLQGRASNAHKIISDAIQRGLDQQKAKFAKHKEAGRARAAYYQELLDRFQGDEAAADNAFKAAAMQAVIARGDLAAAERGDREAKVNWASARAQLMQEMNDYIEKGAQRYEDNAYKAELAAAQARASAIRQQSAMNAQRGPGGISPDLVVPGAEFSGEKMPTKKDAELVNKARAATVDAVSKIDDLLDFVYGPDGVGREVVGFSDNAKLARGKLRDIQMMLKGPEMFNLGVLTGPDMSLLEAVSGSDPTSVLYHDMNRRQLEDLKRRIINNYRARARQSGYIERELGGAPVGTGIDEGAPVH